MEKIKVIHILSIMNNGGAETMVMEMLRNINSQDFEFEIIVHSANPGIFDTEIRKLGSNITVAPNPSLFNLFSYCSFWDDYFKNLSERTIIHCHLYTVAPLVFYYAKKYNHITILHSHSTSTGTDRKSFFRKISKFFSGFLADYRVACSLKAGQWLFGNNFNPFQRNSNDFLWNNAIDKNKFQYSEERRIYYRQKNDISDEDIIIGMVSSLRPVKNHLFLLEVLKDIKEVDERFKLVIIGDGEEKEKILDYIKRNNLTNHVLLLGNRRDVYKYYSMFDIFAIPSHYEGFPLTVIEDQSNGLLCLASSNITKEVKLNSNFEFLDLDKRLWKNKILKLTKKELKRVQLKKNDFDINYYITKIERFYKELGKNQEDFYVH